MILHIDLDCFFVSAARIKDDSLKDQIVAVVGSNNSNIFGDKVVQNSNKGVILSASYEARKFGICSAMSTNEALKLCPKLKLVPNDMEFNKAISAKIYKFLYTFTPEIEKFSIDEFFLNLKGTKYQNDYMNFAKFLQQSILEKFKIPCSVGLCEGKFLAKLATDLKKPFGIKFLDVKNLKQELKDVDIAKFPGIGKSTQKFLYNHSIRTISQAIECKSIFEKMGKNGIKIYNRICGINDSEITTKKASKSIGFGRTFSPTLNRDELKRKISIMCRHLGFDVLENNLNPMSYELKIKYKNRYEFSKRFTPNKPFCIDLLNCVCMKLFDEVDKYSFQSIIYIGINLTNFSLKPENSISLFSYEDDIKQKKLDKTFSKIWSKFGIDKIKKANEI